MKNPDQFLNDVRPVLVPNEKNESDGRKNGYFSFPTREENPTFPSIVEMNHINSELRDMVSEYQHIRRLEQKMEHARRELELSRKSILKSIDVLFHTDKSKWPDTYHGVDALNSYLQEVKEFAETFWEDEE